MKKLIISGGILLVVILISAWIIGSYNSMVTSSQLVDTQWAQVQNVYQRRADLIPNLVATVKGYAAHEHDTLLAVVQARTAAIQPVAATTAPTQTQLNQFDQNQSALSSALSRLMVVVERYPDLKASQNFLTLQAQLEGTENRITVERQRYNEAVMQYNVRVQRFPGKLFANFFGFQPRAYFAATQQAQTAPQVSF